MKIAIHGYGKMGKAVERIAMERGHAIVARFDSSHPLDRSLLRSSDVVVDFSNASALDGLLQAMAGGSAALVIGTTGWNDRAAEIEKACREGGFAMVHGSNFSPGANVVFALAREAARRLAALGQYEAGIEERHHAQKKDSPSGTALRIAREVREGSGGVFDPRVAASRAGWETGLHDLFFDSTDDVVEIVHRTRSRDGFARGAVLAAERIQGMSGIYRFEDLLAL